MTKKGPVLVTGGSGFIGSHLVERLLSLQYRVIVFDSTSTDKIKNLESVKNHPDLTYVEGDIRDEAALGQVVKEGLKKIYHLSAIVGVKHYCTDPLQVIDVNLIGTRNILKLASRHTIPFLLASTSEVYGKNPEVPWKEDADRVLGATHVQRWSYSSSKALAEHLVMGIHTSSNLPITIVRYFNVYGPRQAPIFLISQNIQRALRNEPLFLYDEGSQTRCFTFVEDAVEGTIAAAENPTANGEIFNIGNNRESTVREVIGLIQQQFAIPPKVENVNTKTRYGNEFEDIQRRIPDVEKARRMLGWTANTPLEVGIQKTMAWAKENSWWFGT